LPSYLSDIIKALFHRHFRPIDLSHTADANHFQDPMVQNRLANLGHSILLAEVPA
jgi:hypothetical protein